MALTSIVFFGKKEKGACCPGCAAEMEAKQNRRKQPDYNRGLVK